MCVEPYADHRPVALPALAVLFTFTPGQSQHTNTLLASYARAPSLHLPAAVDVPTTLSPIIDPLRFAYPLFTSLYLHAFHFTSLHSLDSPLVPHSANGPPASPSVIAAAAAQPRPFNPHSNHRQPLRRRQSHLHTPPSHLRQMV